MRVSYLVDEVLAGPVTLEYWLGEVGELREEIVGLSLSGIREEWSDVVCLGLAHLVARGWTWVRWMPVLPGLGLYAARKFECRLHTWQRIFAHHGAVYDRRYLIGGSNFAKLAKVRGALALAGCEQIDVEWLHTNCIGRLP